MCVCVCMCTNVCLCVPRQLVHVPLSSWHNAVLGTQLGKVCHYTYSWLLIDHLLPLSDFTRFVKVSNPSGGVLTSSALNTLRWSQATCELIFTFVKTSLPLCSPEFDRDGLTKTGTLLSDHVTCKGVNCSEMFRPQGS